MNKLSFSDGHQTEGLDLFLSLAHSITVEQRRSWESHPLQLQSQVASQEKYLGTGGNQQENQEFDSALVTKDKESRNLSGDTPLSQNLANVS